MHHCEDRPETWEDPTNSDELNALELPFRGCACRSRLKSEVEEFEKKGELGTNLAERTLIVDPLNLNQVILAEGRKNERI
jgi:hypothetical protein